VRSLLTSAPSSTVAQRLRPRSSLRPCSGFSRLGVVCALLLCGTLGAAPPQVLDRDQVAQLIKQEYGARILDLQSVPTGNGPAFRVKLLQPSGRVKLLLIDAVDGKPLPFDNPDSPE
jgi:hypothetical protein